MTYFAFLLLFLIPPIILLVFFTIRKGFHRLAWLAIGVHILIAVTYTTPWDNYLVATRVWWYDPELVTGLTLGFVPIEEYSFFVLQTLLSGIWIVYLLQNQPSEQPNGTDTLPRRNLRGVMFLSLTWLISLAMLLIAWQPGTYLSLILAWALVPIMLQVAMGGDLLIKNAKPIIAGVLVPTVYLSIADTLAIGFGTWTINPQKTLGILLPGGLPLEESIFFLMTNILIVFGITLSLEPASKTRLQHYLDKLKELSFQLEPKGKDFN